MEPAPPTEPWVVVLAELMTLQRSLRRLETHLLRSLNQFGVSDETIATFLDQTSQAVGKRRRRKI
jgi:hypothetical protein